MKASWDSPSPLLFINRLLVGPVEVVLVSELAGGVEVESVSKDADGSTSILTGDLRSCCGCATMIFCLGAMAEILFSVATATAAAADLKYGPEELSFKRRTTDP